jgi:hypothetical protein
VIRWQAAGRFPIVRRSARGFLRRESAYAVHITILAKMLVAAVMLMITSGKPASRSGSGRVEIVNQESWWVFVPDEPWSGGARASVRGRRIRADGSIRSARVDQDSISNEVVRGDDPEAVRHASAVSWAWYELRTSGPDSTWTNPRSSAILLSSRNSSGW